MATKYQQELLTLLKKSPMIPDAQLAVNAIRMTKDACNTLKAAHELASGIIQPDVRALVLQRLTEITGEK